MRLSGSPDQCVPPNRWSGWNRHGQCRPEIQSSANACDSSAALWSMQWKRVAIRCRRSRCTQGGDDMRRLLATARRAYRRNAMANSVLPRSDWSRPAGQIVSFRGAVLSRPRSDPTGATPYCPGDHRRCWRAATLHAHLVRDLAPLLWDHGPTRAARHYVELAVRQYGPRKRCRNPAAVRDMFLWTARTTPTGLPSWPGPWHLSLSGGQRRQTPGARGLFGVDPQRDDLCWGT